MKVALLDSKSQHTTSMHHACAACKYQRRKCSKDCLLAPYFPSGGDDGDNEDFKNVHKLFGVGKLFKILKKVGLKNRDEAMKSVIFEANARKADPVQGCYGIVVNLLNQIAACEAELGIVMQQVRAFRSVAAGYNVVEGVRSEE